MIAAPVAFVGLTSIAEAFGLYFLRLGGNLNLLKAMGIYGLIVPPLLSKSLLYEGIGIVNFVWNIFSTLIGFAIGIYMFNEKIHNLQIIGVLLSLAGIGMILMTPDGKQQS